MSIGERLRNAREERGLSLEDIGRTTFIRVHHIEAIERDDFSSIPASRLHYFVRDYARSVGLNPEEILSELPEQPAKPAPSPPAEMPAASRKRSGPKKQKKKEKVDEPEEEGETLVLPPPAPDAGRKRGRRPRYSPIDQGNPLLARSLITAAVVLLLGLGIYYFAGGFDSSEEDGASAQVADTASPTRILSRADGTEEEGVIPEGDSLVLEGRFTDNVWYNIEMDNQREEEGILDSGSTHQWKASEQFSISLGNAGGVTFTLNGQPVGTLGPLGQAVHRKIITADGFKGASPNTSGTATTTSSQPRRRSSTSRRRSSRTEETQEGGIQRPQPVQTAPRNVVEPSNDGDGE